MEFGSRIHALSMGLVGLGLLAMAAAIGLSRRGDERMASPPPAASSPTSVVDGLTRVQLEPAVQARSGLRTEVLAAGVCRSETVAFGSVLDLQPLIEWRSRHAMARAEAIAARAAAAVSRAELERNRALFEDQRNVSLKALQAAQASDRADQAKADAAAQNLHSIEAGARQQFGSTLARWAFEPDASPLARLLARQDALVRVTLPPSAGAHVPPREIEVQPGGQDRMPASLVSAAAQADPGLAGRSFLYRVASPLPAGSLVVAYLPLSAPVAQAVCVPSSAVVWYAGQPWAYVQDGATAFARRPLGQATRAEGGYLAAEGLLPGVRIVTRGAGLLLSEEQRPPPGGAGCKDPECD